MTRKKFLPHQTKSWYEWCRKRTIELSQKGWNSRQIAEALGVSEGAISQWLTKYRKGGVQALQSKKGTGRKPKLSLSKQKQLLQLLQKTPEEFGFHGTVWTGPQVVQLINQLWNIEYNPKYIPELLRKLKIVAEQDLPKKS